MQRKHVETNEYFKIKLPMLCYCVITGTTLWSWIWTIIYRSGYKQQYGTGHCNGVCEIYKPANGHQASQNRNQYVHDNECHY